jgi:glycosyltransferase involved in cell wall biosynthesis/predicted glycoside hydrolase/deacetylase ChbG (UPF0249 family)
MSRVLVVNADDFGRAAAINAGVAAAHEQGIVSSASLMVRWPDAPAAADYAHAHPELSLGLHVDVGEWAYQNGGWRRVYDVVAEDDEAVMEQEVLRQLDTFRTLCGIDPTHIDSHQHAHRRGPLGDILRRLAVDMGVPLRHAGPVRVHTGFYGQTSKGFAAHDRITVAALVSWLHELPEGVTELICHPAASAEVGGSYREERVRELEALCDPAVRSAVERCGITLWSFREVASRLTSARSGASTFGAVAPYESLATRAPDADLATEVFTPGRDAGTVPSLTDSAARQVDPGRTRDHQRGATAATLWERGHLLAACQEMDAVLAEGTPDASLLHWRDLADADVRVLSGAWSGAIAARSVSPIQGRILHVVGASLPFGASGYSLRTAYVTQAQQGVGLDPHVVTPLGYPDGRSVPPAGSDEPVGGVPHYRLPTADGIPERLDARLSLTVRLVADLAERLRPAAIHAASDYQNALVALEVGHALDVPVIYEVRGFWEETQCAIRGAQWRSSDEYRWRRDREIDCCHAVDQVVTLGERMRDELVSRGVPSDKITIVPNGVDVDRFVPLPRDADCAASLGIDADQVVIGYVSSLSTYEGVQYLVQAIADLLHRGLDVRGVIVGDGAERERLVQYATSLGIADRVAFTGRVPHEDVLRYYSLIDIFVVPRTADRVCGLVTPLKPYEAMAAARAVVVSRVDALTEIVQNGMTGLVFEPENAEDLANVLESLVLDDARRDALGQAARQWACEHRSWRLIGEKYRQLYELMGVGSGGQMHANRAAGAEVIR